MALRTMLLYPASTPQVHRSNDFVLKAFQALLKNGGDSVNIALSDQKILVCGEHLSDKDQTRPQIQGLIALLGRLRIHSFTFLPTFSLEDCVKFIQTLADLLENKELTEPMSALLERAGIGSISVDTKRYAAVHQGEQVVREELIGSGLCISDEELANFVLGKSGTNGPLQAVSLELIKELINRLPKTTGDQQTEAELSEAVVIEVLQNLSKGREALPRAKERLLDLIATTARAGDYPAAERLRERIYEIDSLALGETIRSTEIIDQEKKGANISEEDLAIWADLADRLSSEEFQTMYHELSEHRYKPEETIVSQGDKNDALFFVAQGSVKVSHRVGPREIFITSLNRGRIAGENFFAPSFWTVSLTSLTPSKIYILQRATLNSWQERFPRLRAKLHEFYLACSDIRSMLEKKGLERRQGQRFTLARKIQVQPITTLDTTIGRGFRAETVDISPGGLAFLIRTSKQENARLLLGRRMQVVLPVGGQANFLYLKGQVISIQPFHIQENDFSVHFKFEYPLDRQKLQSILG